MKYKVFLLLCKRGTSHQIYICVFPLACCATDLSTYWVLQIEMPVFECRRELTLWAQNGKTCI